VATPPSPPDDKPRWLTHTEAADLVGVSYNTVAHWARRGLLQPQKERRTLTNGTVREVTVFDINTVLKVARRRNPNDANDANAIGETAALAFEMFEEGAPVRKVVIKLRQSPERVEALHDQWVNGGGSELVLNPVAQRELERLVGPFDGVADLVQRVAELTNRLAELASRLAAAESRQGPSVP
jgi:hypothetical protein